jgi:long-chain acyl-CoA synthetase
MTQVPQFETLVAMLDHAVEHYGQRPAFGTHRGAHWDWTTYAELGELVARCRGGLAALGIGRGDRVAIIADNRLEWAVAAHATYQRRAVFVPMAQAQAETDWRYILADVGARVCFAANAAIASRVSALREDLLDLQYIINLEAPEQDSASFAHLLALGGERPIKLREPQPGDCATIIYTSGSTGEPKGVRLTHANLAVNACARAESRDYGTDARSMSFLPWAHVFGGHVELNVMMSVGGAVAICSGAEELLAEMPHVNPTVLYTVPRIWTQLYHDIQRDLAAEPDMSRHLFDDGIRLMQRQRRGESLKLTERIFLNMADKLVISKLKARFGGKLRLAISGAAPLSVEVAELMHNLGITIYEGYGLTESSGSTTTNPTDAPRFGSVGTPIRGTRVEIDRSVPEVEPDSGQGEIIIYGPGVMQGYHNLPEATAKALTVDRGVRTGDLGYLDEDGYLYITGRIKDLYKLNSGRYVAPAPLEGKLKLSPFISHCMLYGAGQPYNVALIVADVPALRAHLAREDATPEELIADPRARRLYEEEILKHSRDFRAFELVRNFWLVSEPFTRANGMLTPALKMLRRKVLQKYEARLKSLYP